MKILLADDSVTAQNMGKKILTEAGHEVFTASNGAAAIKLVSERRPDLAILDIYMPGYSGLEVCEKIRGATDVAHILVILTVGKLEPFKKEDAQRVRADALIIKPFEATELVAAVNRIAESLGSSAVATKTAPGSEKNKIKAGRIKLDTDAAVEEPLSAGGAKVAKDDVKGDVKDAAHTQNHDGSTKSGARDVTAEWAPAESPAISEMAVIAPPRPSTSENADEASGADWSDVGRDQMPAIKAAAAAAGNSFDNVFGLEPSASGPEMEAFPVITPAISPAKDHPAAEVSSVAPATAYAGTYSDTAAPVEENSAASGFDPSFSADRTTWVTEFATRFGVQEPESLADETSVEPSDVASISENVASVPDNAPGNNDSGDLAATDPYAALEHESSFQSEPVPLEDGNRPAELRASLPTTIEEPETSAEPETLAMPQIGDTTECDGDYAAGWESSVKSSNFPESHRSDRWMAEELPVEEHEVARSLAEEMGKAPPVGVSDKVSVEVSGNLSTVEISEKAPAVEVPEVELDPRPWPQTMGYDSPSDATHDSAESNQPIDAVTANSEPDTATAKSGPDTDALPKSAQDKAIESAAREAISLINAEMHATSADSAHTSPLGTSAIEDMVSRVLQQLKPKLVAEITRELTIDPSKDPQDS